MHMNETIWEENLDIASLVAVGAMNRAPTRRGAWADPRPQARRGPIHRARGHEPQRCASLPMSSQIHVFICISCPYGRRKFSINVEECVIISGNRLTH